MDEFIPAKIDLGYAEENVIFRISNCSTDKKYSFWKLSREQAEKFLRCLKHKEKLTWKQLCNLSRDNGLTKEKEDSDSFRMIDELNDSAEKMVGEKYYFHLRVEQNGLFRIFGYQLKQYFYITHIDRDGGIHH